jgi:hypothetical protein
LSLIAFFRPAFLWGLLAVAIPVIVHLLFRHRTVSFDFSSLRFLQQTAVRASRRRRLRRLLLLLTRMAAVAVLVLLFAHPYRRKDPFLLMRSPQATVFCWVDPTISMDYRRDDVPLWRDALSMIGALDSGLAPSARLLCYDERQERFLDWRMLEPSEKPAPRHGPSGVDAALRAFRERLETGGEPGSLVLFSDWQEQTAAALDSFLVNDSVFFPIALVSMGARKPWNISLRESGLYGNRVVRAVVDAQGRAVESEELVVELGSMRAGRHTVTLEPDEQRQVEIPVSLPAGESAGRVRLVRQDPFLHDNRSYFTADNGRVDQVVAIADPSAAFPVVAAFDALLPEETPEPRAVPAHRLDRQLLDSADVILLVGEQAAPEILQSALATDGLEQKVLIVAPLHGSTLPPWQALGIPKRGGTVSRWKQSEQPLHPVLPDTMSLLWRGFPRLQERDGAVYNYLEPLPGTPLAYLSNGAVLASGHRDEQGNYWIFSATPLVVTEANNLCETGFYLPFIDRLTEHGMASVWAGRQSWTAGVPHANPFSGSRSSARVFDQNGRLYAEWDRQQSVVIAEPGLYTVRPEGRASFTIAVAMAADEADFTYRLPSVPDQKAAHVRSFVPGDFRRFIHNGLRSPVYGVLWLLLAALLLIEVLLWRWR